LEQVGPRTVYVSVFRLPPYVPDEALQTALGAYGKILRVNHPTYKDRPTLFTGTRVVRMEMAKPVPNFVTVAGHRVMMEYRGMKRSLGPLVIDESAGVESPTSPEAQTGAATSSTSDPEFQTGHSALWRLDVKLLREAAAAAELRTSIAETLSLQPLDATQWDGLK
ncbi:unnamed protein product, partial [Ixodes hexagonus]